MNGSGLMSSQWVGLGLIAVAGTIGFFAGPAAGWTVSRLGRKAAVRRWVRRLAERLEGLHV